jgi:hypothetical protein
MGQHGADLGRYDGHGDQRAAWARGPGVVRRFQP